jgi:hypothetical protein
MTKTDLLDAIGVLREKFTSDSPATIEQMAAICGIDVNAPRSYRAVLDMSESFRFAPDIVRVWINGERRYYATRAQPASAAIAHREGEMRSGRAGKESNAHR